MDPIKSDMGKTLNSDTRRWVVFRLGHLGDVVLTTGVLSALGNRRNWSFAFITKSSWAGVFDRHPYVHAVIPLDASQLTTRPYLALCRRLANEYSGWGLLDLHGCIRSRMLSLVWQGPVLRYPKLGMQRRLFLASHGRLSGGLLRATSVAQRYYMAVDPSPPSAAELLPRVWLTDAEHVAAKARLQGIFTEPVAPVALHPFATHALKAWPESHWRKLVSLLNASGIPWIIVGKGRPLYPESNRDLSNRTSLRESCAIIAQSRVLISGDSGPMHLGDANGTPVIALFGPTTREWGFFPAGPRDIVLESALGCRPCSLHGKKPCPNSGSCLAAIAPEDVFRAIEQTAKTMYPV